MDLPRWRSSHRAGVFHLRQIGKYFRADRRCGSRPRPEARLQCRAVFDRISRMPDRHQLQRACRDSPLRFCSPTRSTAPQPRRGSGGAQASPTVDELRILCARFSLQRLRVPELASVLGQMKHTVGVRTCELMGRFLLTLRIALCRASSLFFSDFPRKPPILRGIGESRNSSQTGRDSRTR